MNRKNVQINLSGIRKAALIGWVILLPLTLLSVSNAKASGSFYRNENKMTEDNFLQHPVSGIVTDQDGDPLVGVTIKIEGTTSGTVTDMKGRFNIEAPDGSTLELSYIGYQAKKIQLNGQTFLTVTMSPVASGLNEVVVVGYGTQKKEEVTGAISTVSAKDITSHPVNNVVEALQGVAPNLNIAATADGGATDASMSLNIRGVGSLSSSQPYILIDGVRATQTEFSELNPNDIQSISILKDAASAAIYGAQAAYGVILVKTKAGRKNEKFTLDYLNSFRLKRRISIPSDVNSVTFAKVYNEASENLNGQTIFSNAQIARMQAFIDGKLKYGTAPDPDNPNQWLGIESGTSHGWYTGFANTNWWKIMFKPSEMTQQHNLSLRGGSDKMAYYLSGGFFEDPGQMRYGSKNEYFRRYNLNSNVSANITDWLKISNITRFTQVNNSFPATLQGSTRGRLFHDILRFPPMAPWRTPPVKDSAGNVIVPSQLALNPAFNIKNGTDQYAIDNLVSTFKASIKINKNLSLNGNYTFKRRFENENVNFKAWSLIGPQGTPSITYQKNNNHIYEFWHKLKYSSINLYANYIKSISGVHNFGLLVGYQQESYNQQELTVGRDNVVDNELNSLNAAVGTVLGPNNPITSWGTMGAFGRFTYNFKNKYLLEFNGRYDGSSKFAKGHRFGLFPSISLGYNINKEKFWKPIKKIINRLKIRGSWGKLGNQEVNGYLYLPTISISTQLPWEIGGERPVYTNPPGISSPDITWEVATTRNVGFDLGFLKDRLSASLDIYTRLTDNMFGPSGALPAVLGTSPPETNSASLKTKGFGLVIGWKDNINKFGYHVKFMVSNNRTFITKYNNPTKLLSTYYVGEELGDIWGFTANGLFQSEDEVKKYTSAVDLSYLGTNWQPGDVKYVDLNGDGKVNVGDNTLSNPGDQRIIGNSHPQYQFSFEGGLSWKNFSFSMFWQGVGKRDYFFDTYASLFWGFNNSAQTHLTQYVLDRVWSKNNPNGYLPIQLSAGGASGFTKDRQPTTRYLQNAAYVRLKSLNIAYTFSPSLVRKVHLKSLKVYFSGSNLITITSFWPNFDPELEAASGAYSDGREYPLAQVFSLGINASL